MARQPVRRAVDLVKRALWWVRRDLRLTDNQALAAALEHAEQVVPVFVIDPALWDSPMAGEKRVAFLSAGLRALGAELGTAGSRLVIRRGDPVRELATLADEVGAEAAFAEEDYWPYGRARDKRVAERLSLHLTGGLTVHPPLAVLKADGTPYGVFTPYSRTWKSLPLPGAESVLAAPRNLGPASEVESLPLPEDPELPATVPFAPGEAEAQRRLQSYVAGADAKVYRYADDRDRMDLDGTSQLSPYLRFGMLSARQAVVGALRAMEAAPGPNQRKGAETWLNELIWREFYQSILYHFPEVEEESYRPELRKIAWENDEDAFAAWKAGLTGYPVVDAAMRQLVETGWMHNRGRMVVASFLVKDLLVDWRWGERFFLDHLVDADPAANNGGWQWTAGTGTDAAPYFRIFNPILQGKKHDPDGAYVRRWVPELTRVPDRYLHVPWEMPSDLQRQVGCVIGIDYPAPLVDHAWARERTLDAFAKAKERV
jgi:deoxyribodipyrimidine photo-lyase